MPRTPKPRWHEGNQLWVSDVGERYIDKKGRARRRTVSFPDIGRKDRRKAEEALKAHLDAEAVRERNANDPTAATVCELYLEAGEGTWEPSTLDVNSEHLGRFMAWRPHAGAARYGERFTSDLTPEDLERMLKMMEARYKPTTRALAYQCIMAAFNWAAARVPDRSPERLIAANPFAGVKRPPIPRAPERYADRKELAGFLRWLWRRAGRKGTRGRVSIEGRFEKLLCLMIRLTAHTGARPGELCIAGRRRRERGLKWTHWNPDAGTNGIGQRVGLITLPPDHHKTGKKTKRNREIVVPPVLTRALERHKGRGWAHPAWVFTHRRGNHAGDKGDNAAALGSPWTSAALSQKITKLRREAIAAGVPLSDDGDNRFVLYRLRHTAATNHLRDGFSADQSAALLGTSARMIETTYGHLTGSRLIALDDAARKRARQKPS